MNAIRKFNMRHGNLWHKHQPRRWALLLVGLTLFITACSSTLGSIKLSGLQALKQGTAVQPGGELASGSLLTLANQAEAESAALDVVEIRRIDEQNIVIFTLLKLPEIQESQSEEESNRARIDVLRIAVEVLWEAAVKHTPDAASVTIIFMNTRTFTTLDRGPAPAAWQLLGITASLKSVPEYLAGTRDLDTYLAYTNGPAVRLFSLDQIYAGEPNHPIRFLEAS